MIKKDIPAYVCSIEIGESIDLKNVKEINNHKVGKYKSRNFIIPNQINSATINPKNFIKLKEELKIGEILLMDKTKGAEGIISISDHVNKSGLNLLRSKTPEGNLPQFPDMSKIYNQIEGFEQRKVHTIGADRFKDQQAAGDIVYSNLVGIIAPVAHYAGIKVFALGSPNIQNIIDKL